MTNEILSLGTKLADENGIWIVTNITHYDGSYWYDIRKMFDPSSQITIFHSNLKFYTILK